MQRVKRSTAVALLPAAPAGGTPGYFAQPNPQGGVPATQPGFEWYNGVQEELMAVIEGQGLSGSDTDHTKLRQAITKMIQSGQRAVIINNATFSGAVTGTGKAVYWDSANSRFDLALADGSAKQNIVGFADVANANVYAFGDAVLFAGLTAGSRYYLDGATAGSITVTAPANPVFVGIAKGATELFVDVDAAGGVSSSQVQSQTFTAFTAGGAAPAFTLTPSPAITSYIAGQRFRVAFGAAGTTGSNTLNVSGQGIKNVKQYDATGAKVPAIITAAQLADVEYDGTDFVILDPLPGGLGAPVGSARNLRMSVTAASASATLAADEIIVETALGGAAYRLASFSQAVNLAATGAGGMDTGAAPVSGFVSLYAIFNPATNTKNILACNVTTSSGSIYSGANMPAGYTASALVGVWPTNGSSQFMVGYQKDRTFWNDAAGVNVLNITATPPTSYTSVSLTSAVPPNAQGVILNVGQPNSGNAAMCAVVAATPSGAGSALVNLTGNSVTVDSFYSGVQAVVPLITAQTIYYKVGTSVNGVRINVTGYTF